MPRLVTIYLKSNHKETYALTDARDQVDIHPSLVKIWLFDGTTIAYPMDEVYKVRMNRVTEDELKAYSLARSDNPAGGGGSGSDPDGSLSGGHDSTVRADVGDVVPVPQQIADNGQHGDLPQTAAGPGVQKDLGGRAVIGAVEIPNLSRVTTFHLFHRLWTKTVGTSGYVKAEWQELERRINARS